MHQNFSQIYCFGFEKKTISKFTEICYLLREFFQVLSELKVYEICSCYSPRIQIDSKKTSFRKGAENYGIVLFNFRPIFLVHSFFLPDAIFAIKLMKVLPTQFFENIGDCA